MTGIGAEVGIGIGIVALHLSSSQTLPPPAWQGEGDHEVVEGGAQGGRCPRSGHKNSVKGKGAIKHKGAPTIIYHCTE